MQSIDLLLTSLKIEEDLQLFLELAAEFYGELEQSATEGAILSFLAQREGKDLQQPLTSLDLENTKKILF